MISCAVCGRPSASHAKFCAYCGAWLSAQDEAAKAAMWRDIPTTPPKRQPPQVRPWVRYWARSIDIYWFCFLCWAVVIAGNAVHPNDFTVELGAVIGFAFLFVWAFVEALFLSTFGATPGKWILRTAVHREDGGVLSYDQALRRALSVWWIGLGAGLPIISMITCAFGYRRLTKNRLTVWDEPDRFVVTHDRIGIFRTIIATIFLVAATLGGVVTSAWLNKAQLAAVTQTTSSAEVVAPMVGASATAHVAAQPVAAPPAVTNLPADDWDRHASTFEHAHPDLNDGNNTAIMQEYINSTPATGVPIDDVLQGAYVLAVRDSRWTIGTASSVTTTGTDDEKQWEVDVSDFMRAHPTINYKDNPRLFQEKLNQIALPSMTNKEMLQAAYLSAVADPLWAVTQ